MKVDLPLECFHKNSQKGQHSYFTRLRSRACALCRLGHAVHIPGSIQSMCSFTRCPRLPLPLVLTRCDVELFGELTLFVDATVKLCLASFKWYPGLKSIL